MKLTRNDLYRTFVRRLSEEERDAIHNVWGEGRTAIEDEVRIFSPTEARLRLMPSAESPRII